MSAPIPRSGHSTGNTRPASAQWLPRARRGTSAIAFSVSGYDHIPIHPHPHHRPLGCRPHWRRTRRHRRRRQPGICGCPRQAVPAVGAIVTCDSVGALTGTSGYLRQRETTAVDGRGRAHVLFAIATDRVRLVGADGTRYRLIGAGFDSVVYPGSTVTGDVLHEDEHFNFDVSTSGHVVGVVRFRLHTGADRTPHVHDASTCQLPNMS